MKGKNAVELKVKNFLIFAINVLGQTKYEIKFKSLPPEILVGVANRREKIYLATRNSDEVSSPF